MRPVRNFDNVCRASFAEALKQARTWHIIVTQWTFVIVSVVRRRWLHNSPPPRSGFSRAGFALIQSSCTFVNHHWCFHTRRPKPVHQENGKAMYEMRNRRRRGQRLASVVPQQRYTCQGRNTYSDDEEEDEEVALELDS